MTCRAVLRGINYPSTHSLSCRHLPLPRSDADSKKKHEASIEQVLRENDIDILVLARLVCHWQMQQICTHKGQNCAWLDSLFSAVMQSCNIHTELNTTCSVPIYQG